MTTLYQIQEQKKKYVLAILIAYPFIAAWYSNAFNISAFESLVVFLGVPALILSFLERVEVGKAALFALLTSTVFTIIIDYIGQVNELWLIPDTIFPFRIFGVITIEIILCEFFLIYTCILFYEYFFDDHHIIKKWNPRMKILLFFLSVLFSSFLVGVFFFPGVFHIPHFYWVWGIAFCAIPTVYELVRRPSLLKKVALTTAYFFLLTCIYDLTAVQQDWWLFPAQTYLWEVTLWGSTLPIEEFIVWMIFANSAYITYYEFFDDNES